MLVEVSDVIPATKAVLSSEVFECGLGRGGLPISCRAGTVGFDFDRAVLRPQDSPRSIGTDHKSAVAQRGVASNVCPIEIDIPPNRGGWMVNPRLFGLYQPVPPTVNVSP